MMIVFMRVSNFIQLWTVVDFSGYYYNVSIYRRNGEKESARFVAIARKETEREKRK